MHIKLLIPIIFLALLFLPSCKEKEEVIIPADVMSVEEIIPVMTDVQILEAAISKRVIEGNNMKEAAIREYALLFKKHETNREHFERSYLFYSRHPEILESIFEEVLKELSKAEAKIKKINGKTPS